MSSKGAGSRVAAIVSIVEIELQHLADEVEHAATWLEHLEASIHNDLGDFRVALMKTLWQMSVLTAGNILVGVGILIYLK